MSYFSKKDYDFVRFEKSKVKNKMYTAVLINKKTGRTKRINFGDSNMANFHDKTGLNLYPHLIHGDDRRRANFRARHKGYLKKDYYSPSAFSYYFLW
jgi:hypothetical protein